MDSRALKIRKIFALMGKIGFKESDRFQVISNAIAGERGRGGFSALSEYDLNEVIKYLESHPLAQKVRKNWLSNSSEAAQRMRRKIIAMAHDMKWQLPNGKCDIQRIDKWCVSYGKFNKHLMQHSEMELVELVSQFELVHLDFIKSLRGGR